MAPRSMTRTEPSWRPGPTRRPPGPIMARSGSSWPGKPEPGCGREDLERVPPRRGGEATTFGADGRRRREADGQAKDGQGVEDGGAHVPDVAGVGGRERPAP